jgi:hypothetical protein
MRKLLLLLLLYITALVMGTETVPETSVIFNQLIRLKAREDFNVGIERYCVCQLGRKHIDENLERCKGKSSHVSGFAILLRAEIEIYNDKL